MKFGIIKLYYLLFIFLSFGVVISFSLLNGARIYLYDLPVLVIAPISFFYLWSVKNKIGSGKYLLGFLVAGLIGLFFFLSTVPELIGSIAYLIRLILYLLLAVPILFFTQKDVKKLYKTIVISGLLFLGIGYFQYFFYVDLANLYYLGWDRHLYRLFSTFLDPNFAGIYLVLLFIISLSFLSLLNSKWRKRWIFLITILYIPAIFLTYSRTAYITLFVTICIYLFFMYKKLVILFILIFIAILVLLPKNFGGEGVNLLRTSSIFSRLEANEVGFTIFIQNPIIGVGFNAFKYAQLREGTLMPSQINSHAASGVPNSYLFALATSGVIGFFFLLLFISQILRMLSKNAKKNTLSIAVFSGLIGVLIASLFENALFYGPILILFIICTSLALRYKEVA